MTTVFFDPNQTKIVPPRIINDLCNAFTGNQLKNKIFDIEDDKVERYFKHKMKETEFEYGIKCFKGDEKSCIMYDNYCSGKTEVKNIF